jgi:hypothetical protein
MDPLVRGMNLRMRIRTKMSARISNTAWRGMQVEDPRLPSENISGYDRQGITDRILIFYTSRNPDLGVKKAPDPRSGSATLPQRIQGARLSIQSSELGPPTPSSASRCCPPPPTLVFKWGDTLACGGGGGNPMPTKGQTLWYVAVPMYVPYHIP